MMILLLVCKDEYHVANVVAYMTSNQDSILSQLSWI